MPPTWLVAVSVVVLAVSVLSALATLLDILIGRHPQDMAVMNVVWPVTCFYFGPFGYLAYRVMGRQNARGHSSQRGHSGHSSQRGHSGHSSQRGHSGHSSQRGHSGHSSQRGHSGHSSQRGHSGHSSQRGHSGHSGHASGKPFWQGVFVSTCHCGAGCSIGDIIGEYTLFLLGLTLLGSRLLSAYTVDFMLAYLLGIAFQFFAIVPMRDLGPLEGLVAAIKADTLSLIAFEVGMFGWMAVNSLLLFQPSLDPTSPVYWFMMQIAMVVGFATSYPANWWLVKSGIKEAM